VSTTSIRPARRRWKIVLAILVPLAAIATGAVGMRNGRATGTAAFVETIARRDLEAIVRESGKVRAKTSVLLSANTVGQVRDVHAREGERVKAGQLLISIDPTPFETAIAQSEVAVQQAEQRLEIARTQLERTRLKLEREVSLGTAGTREKMDELKADIEVQKNELEAARLTVTSEKARLERDRHELTKVRITSPIDGVVLRSNVEKGQTTMMGSPNVAGTELMTVADLSVLQVELEVGEAAVLDVKPGQEARVEIDALPNRKLKGKVSEVGTSPIIQMAQQDRGVAFKVIVTLDETVEGVRPGFSASAEIVTATRSNALSVPIRALVGRTPPGEKEPQEGAVAVRAGKALFVRVKTGITGKEHFELLEGLAEGDEVVTGPHKTLRDLKDGDLVERKAE